MQKEKADEVALRLAEHVILAHHTHILSQDGDNVRMADEVVSLVEALSERLQHSTLN